ncbi:nuclear transport factor 2 family protein [Cellvibrio fontiphilus]|uniref:Nuclear transport factor 2 family protein n=1 Tax=Cellvibrio fontiphilus TaxID=1815559 RepID=A0ABV7FGF4_9GAMM
MKRNHLIIGLFALGWSGQLAAQSCLESEALIALDGRYETALQTGDVEFLQALLAPEFSWVHNLASMKETKAGLIARLQQESEQPKARKSHDITTHRLGNTAVLQGVSSVEKWNADGKTYRTLRYQFIRTYVAQGSQCKLLAVQTMKVSSPESQVE